MKIIKLKAENFKKLKAVEIEPKDNTVVITGKNGQGKTSVLDSIFVALAGKDKATTKPIREGEDRAEIEVDLGEYKVKRIFTKGGSKLEVYSDNAKFTSPQKMLDEIIGKLTFDPLGFANMKQKEQRETLLNLVDIDFGKLDSERTEFYNMQTYKGQEIKGLGRPTDAEVKKAKELKDKEETNISDLTKKYNEAVEQRRNYEYSLNEIKVNNERIEELEKEIKKLQEDNDRLKQAKDTTENIESLKADLDGAEAKNAEIREAKRIAEQIETVNQKNAEYTDLTTKIDNIDKTKKELLENAKMPINGLSVDDESVLFDGIPFSQISTSEKLKVSLSIAIAMNPKLRVARILDGSLLDDDNMQIVKDMAKQHDMQIWIEEVSSDDKIGFYIEDGKIKNQ